MNPLQECLNDLEVWWAIRLSSFDGLSLDATRTMFNDYKYIISEEGDGITTKYHQHIVLVADTDTEGVRAIIKATYPACQGNKCIYIKACRDKKQLAKYTLKEGSYCYKGFSSQYITDTFKCAIAKTDLKKDMTKNEDDFIIGKIELLQFTETYLTLKVKHDQPLYMNHVQAYITKMACRRNPKLARSLAMDILEKIHQ